MAGHLVPEGRRLGTNRDRFEIENSFGGKTGGQIQQAIEGCDKQASDEKHHKAKRHLQGNQRMHQPAP
jgi:hypothetical protein